MSGNNSSRVLVGLNSKDKIMAQPKTDPFIKGLLLLTQTDQITNRSNWPPQLYSSINTNQSYTSDQTK